RPSSSGKPPTRLSLAAFTSASVGPSATNRATTSRATFTASSAWSGRVWKATRKAPACRTAAELCVREGERKVSGAGPPVARLADDHMGLRRGERDALLLRGGQRRDL